MNYAQKAIDLMKKIDAVSYDKDIQRYMFYHNGKRFIYNIDYIDNPDGSITGYVLGLDRNGYVISRDGFRIEPDGNIIHKGVFRNYVLHRKIIKEVKS